MVYCKTFANINVEMQGLRILTLLAGCMARSDSVRLVDMCEIVKNRFKYSINALVDNLVNVRTVGVSLESSTST